MKMTAQMNWLKVTSSWGRQVAEHNDTSIEVLLVLAKHADADVRTAVAEHRATPVSTIMALAQDESLDLRYALAENHNIHQDVLKMLAEDDNPFIAQRARKTLARLKCASTLLADFRANPVSIVRLA